MAANIMMVHSLRSLTVHVCHASHTHTKKQQGLKMGSKEDHAGSDQTCLISSMKNLWHGSPKFQDKGANQPFAYNPSAEHLTSGKQIPKVLWLHCNTHSALSPTHRYNWGASERHWHRGWLSKQLP